MSIRCFFGWHRWSLTRGWGMTVRPWIKCLREDCEVTMPIPVHGAECGPFLGHRDVPRGPVEHARELIDRLREKQEVGELFYPGPVAQGLDDIDGQLKLALEMSADDMKGTDR